jgi:iron complex transport system ATP-binding protein
VILGANGSGKTGLVRITTLTDLATDPNGPPLVIVTHHVEEIPSGITHAMMLRQGNVLATRLLDEVLTSESRSDCFGLAPHLERRKSGRFSAWALH